MTVQAAHDQILVDMLDELDALRAYLVHLRRSPSLPPLMMDFDCPFSFCHKKGGVHLDTCRGFL